MQGRQYAVPCTILEDPFLVDYDSYWAQMWQQQYSSSITRARHGRVLSRAAYGQPRWYSLQEERDDDHASGH